MSIFADTSFFLALFNRNDAHHRAAAAITQSQLRQLVTSTAVLLELGNALSQSRQRSVFLRLLELLENIGSDIIFVSPELHRRGLDLFASRMDKDWSFTDCISFVIMQERKITDAATADEHFRQAGFNALLLAPAR
jgi:uncharacterized protein